MPASFSAPRTYTERRHAASDAFVRCCAAAVLAHIGKRYVDEVLRELWPADATASLLSRIATTKNSDRAAAILTRSASTPATLTGENWASQLATVAVASLVLNLGPLSAGTSLLQRGAMLLDFNGNALISVPSVTPSASQAGYVDEAAPIRVVEASFSALTMEPKHLKTIGVFTREMATLSTPSIEQITGAVLREAVGLALDAVMLSNAAADAVSPPGLLNGVAALPPGLTMADDVGNLLAAISPLVGNGTPVLIGTPQVAMKLRLQRELIGFDILASSALSPSQLISVAPAAIACAIDSVPRVDVSKEATLHFEDASPAAIGTEASPNVVAAPTISLYQSDNVAVKVTLQANWLLRAPGAIAWTTVSW
jgi:hypothetical protein